jgi:hypothetical protein
VQNARDTFYVMLRDRVAAENPGRTMVIRGAVRPAVMVIENELPAIAVDNLLIPDAFCLHWTDLDIDSNAPLPLITTTCEIHYATSGSASAAGMDRGRALAAMDSELLTALTSAPQAIVKTSYTSGSPVTLATNIFWAQPVVAPTKVNAERLERTVTVTIYSYQEAGEA